MPHIEHEATIEVYGEIIEFPLWIDYTYHDAIPEAREAGGLAISPAEPANVEINSIKVITRYGKVGRLGYAPPKFESADWLISMMTPEQRGEISQAIAEEVTG